MVIGVTGSFGTGKTTVAKIFKELGAIVIDADEIVHRLIEPDAIIYKKVVRTFGKRILKDKDRRINRQALAKIIFEDRKQFLRLCAIIHPAVIREIKAKINRANPQKIIVIDAPLLIEAGLNRNVDKIIVVKAGESVQIERIKKCKGLTKDEIGQRLEFQMPLGKKIKFADFVIDNNGSLEKTRRQVKEIWKKIKSGKVK